MSSHGVEPNQRPQPDRDAGSENTDEDEDESLVERLVSHPGDRKTSNVKMLVIEAELAHAGRDPGNYAKPITEEIGDVFFERLENHDIDDIKPAWTYQDETTERLDE